MLFRGGVDVSRSAVPDAQSRLKLVDPVFVRGLGIVDFSREALEDFMTIPPFKAGEETDALRRRLRALYD